MQQEIKIVFIGAGNLATNLAVALTEKGFYIYQIYSRTIESAKMLADKIGSNFTNIINDIDNDADLYIFSVKDSVLEDLIAQIAPNKGIWIHTAGSISVDIFKKYNSRHGVVYPFQTFSKNRKVELKDVPFFIEADSDNTYRFLNNIFSTISDKVLELSSEKRKYIHLTGVFACNFVNHMYHISSDILKAEGIPFDVLLPLINETASKIHSLSPEAAQTGPAIRFDKNIMDKHLALMTNRNHQNIYKLISQNIYKNNN